MENLQSVRTDVELNLAAALPVELPPDSETPSMRLQIALVYPSNFSVVMTGPQGEVIEYISLDDALYFNDGGPVGWIKFQDIPEGETEGVLSVMDLVEAQLQEIDSPDIEWKDVALTEDGFSYIVSFLKETELTETGGLVGIQPPTTEVRMTVDAETFVLYSTYLLVPLPEGESRKFAEFRFSDHDEAFTIEPPDEYTDVITSDDAEPSAEVPEGELEEVVLSKNAEGDVEVTFSKAVTVEGEIGLYVMESPGSGWTLPYIGGSGTDTLTFDAHGQDNPPLVAGESIILDFAFEDFESTIMDGSGRDVNPFFDQWVYPD